MAGLYNNDGNNNDALILSDSLGRNIRNIFKTNKLFFPGCTVDSLTNKIATGEIDIRNYRYIILLIGTNDLAPKEVWKFYKKERKNGNSGENLPAHDTTPIPVLGSSFLNLFNSIKYHNNSCMIFSIAIPPRPYDNHRNYQHHIDANIELKRLCLLNNIIFVKSYTLFVKYGKIIENLFIDGLHFTAEGSEKISRLIESTVNTQRSIESKQNL